MNAAADRQVTKDEFFAKMNPLGVHPRIQGRYPYTSHWELQYSRRLIGKSVGHADGSHTYFLTAS